MKFITLGINHKTAPIEIREIFFLADQERKNLLKKLKQIPSILGGFILSTCNRTEIYIQTSTEQKIINTLFELLCEIKNIAGNSNFQKYFYTYSDTLCIEHLFRVVGGLDSLVIGEKQILGQFKNAIEFARNQNMLNTQLNILSNSAIRVGKKSRHETEISFGGSSISWAAIQKAKDTLGDLQEKSFLLIGAGKMTALSAKQLNNKDVRKITFINRTESSAATIANQVGGQVEHFSNMERVLLESDVCICSTSAPFYILKQETLKTIMHKRNNKPLLLIDISMPRNIDPSIKGMDFIHLYTIDDLDKDIKSNLKKRQNATKHVEEIISEKIEEYYKKITKFSKKEHISSVGFAQV